jgi:hypothetical protein
VELRRLYTANASETVGTGFPVLWRRLKAGASANLGRELNPGRELDAWNDWALRLRLRTPQALMRLPARIATYRRFHLLTWLSRGTSIRGAALAPGPSSEPDICGPLHASRECRPVLPSLISACAFFSWAATLSFADTERSRGLAIATLYCSARNLFRRDRTARSMPIVRQEIRHVVENSCLAGSYFPPVSRAVHLVRACRLNRWRSAAISCAPARPGKPRQR